MKKLRSIIIILLFSICLPFCTAEEPARGECVPKITNGVTRTAIEWFSSPGSRALLTISLSLDYNAEIYPVLKSGIDFSRNTYVGRDGSLLYICYHLLDFDHPLLIVYSAIRKSAYYALLEASDDIVLLDGLREICSDGLFGNEPSDLLKVMQSLSDTLEDPS